MRFYVKIQKISFYLGLIAATTLIGLQPLSAKIWYVGSGGQWADKLFGDVKATPNAAYTAAAAGDEIWIAEGTYSTTQIRMTPNEPPYAGKLVSFYGGFAGTETSIDERAKVPDGKGWEFAHPTVLKQSASNSTMLYIFNIESTTVANFTIDGLIFEGNNNGGGSAINWTTLDGVTTSTADPSLRNLNVSIKSCVIRTFGGSGFYSRSIVATRTFVIDSCLIENNVGVDGGGLRFDGSKTLKNSVIRNNIATNHGGGIYAYQGPITITNCLISGNIAAFNGGGIGLYAVQNQQNIHNCIVVNNAATNGGGFSFGSSSTGAVISRFSNLTIANNQASELGAGVYFAKAGQSVYNTIFYNNKLTTSGAVENVYAAASTEPAAFCNNIIDKADYANITQTGCIVTSDSAAIFGENWATSRTSPGINSGYTGTISSFTLPTVDYAGNPRITGSAIDIGPYEYQLTPNTPTNLAAYQVGEMSLVLSWSVQGNDASTKYIIACDGVSVDSTETSIYAITGLSAWREYTFTVRAKKIVGNQTYFSLTSAPLKVRTVDVTPPAAPVNLKFAGATGSTLALEWDAGSDNGVLQGYTIAVSGLGATITDTLKLADMLPEALAGLNGKIRYTASGLSASAEYAVEVKAFDAAGNFSGAAGNAFSTNADAEPAVWYVGSWVGKPADRVKSRVDLAYDAAAGVQDAQVWIQGEHTITASIAMAGKNINGFSFYGGFAGYENSPDERAKAGEKGWEFACPAKIKRDGGYVIYSSPDNAPKGNIVIDGLVLEGNSSGSISGIYWGSSSQTANVFIRNCVIQNFGGSASTANGGGINLGGHQMHESFVVEDCLIQGNNAQNGGGICMDGYRTIRNCEIRSNVAVSSGNAPTAPNSPAAPMGAGGGIYVYQALGVSSITGCRLEENTAYSGGGIFLRCTSDSAGVHNNIVVNNTAGYGGGLSFCADTSVKYSAGRVTNLTVASNRATVQGAGVHFASSNQQVYNTIFWGNLNTKGGVAVVENAYAAPNIPAPTFDHNIVDRAGYANITQTSCIIASDSAAIFGENWVTQPASPGVDNGASSVGNKFALPDYDFAGGVRVAGVAIDIGPFELQPEEGAPSVKLGLPVVTGVTVKGGTASVRLSWTPPTDNGGVAGYCVYVEESGTFSHSWKEPQTPNAAYTVDYLYSGTMYKFGVAAMDIAGNISKKSDMLTYTVPAEEQETAGVGEGKNPATLYPLTIELKQTPNMDGEIERLGQKHRKYDRQPAGIYVDSGAKINVAIVSSALSGDNTKPALYIGTYGYFDETPQKIILDNTSQTITANQSGLIWLQYTSGKNDLSPTGTAKVTISLQNSSSTLRRAPRYVHGVTTNDEFAAMMNRYEAPAVLFQSDYALVVPSRATVLENSLGIDKIKWMNDLDSMLATEDRISGLDNADANALHRRLPAGEIRHAMLEYAKVSGVFASAIPLGYIHFPNEYAQYFLKPFGTWSSSAVKNYLWGVAHEAGHQHQQWSYLIDNATEATVNIYSYAVIRNIIKSRNEPYFYATDAEWEVAKNGYLAQEKSSRQYSEMAADTSKTTSTILNVNKLRFLVWEQLFIIFGDEFYHRLHRISREEGNRYAGTVSDNMYPVYDEDRKAFLIRAASQLTGYDLRDYFDEWGIRVTNTSKKVAMDNAIAASNLVALPDGLTAADLIAARGANPPAWAPLPLVDIRTVTVTVGEGITGVTPTGTSHKVANDSAFSLTFTLSSGYENPQVMVGSNSVTPDLSGDVYTVAITSVTADVTVDISATPVEVTPPVENRTVTVVAGTGIMVADLPTDSKYIVSKDSAFSLTFTVSSGYEKPQVTVGDVAVDSIAGVYTVAITSVTADVTIDISATPVVVTPPPVVNRTVTVTAGTGITGVTPAGSSHTVTSGSAFSLTFTLSSGYENPQVMVGRFEVTPAQSDGVYIVAIPAVTVDVAISISATAVPTGVDDADANDVVVSVAYYNLYGREVRKPYMTGVYIVKETYLSKKVVVSKRVIIVNDR